MTRARIPLRKFVREYSVRNKANEDIPVYSVTNSHGFCTEYFSKDVASQDKTTYKVVPRGYFAYNPSRINVGSVDWQKYEDRVIVSPLYNVFAVSDEVDCQYLYYFLRSHIGRQMIKAKASGSVRDNLKIEMLKEMTIPDISIQEQRFDASVLDKLQLLIGLKKEELQQLNDLVKARFVEMFGEIHDSKRYSYTLLKNITNIVSGGTPNRDKQDFWKNGTIPWIKTTELKNRAISEADEYITREGLKNSSAKVVPPNTVLVAMYGQGKTRGMTGFLKIEASTNQACACILPSSNINPVFLWKYFELSYDKLRGMAKGGNQPNLNGNILKNFPILIPPKDLQDSYVSFTQQVDKSKSSNTMMKNKKYTNLSA